MKFHPLKYEIENIDGDKLPAEGFMVDSLPFAVRLDKERGKWQIDHLRTGCSAHAGVYLGNRRTAAKFASELAALPLPWDANTRGEFSARMSRLDGETLTKFRDLVSSWRER